MTITSYAQNFEDIMLWRALGHIERGFYIDVGAQDPVIDSVSLAFYEKGWRGVHVEPNATYAEQLRNARPDETVIEAAVSQSADKIEFFVIADTGLSTGDAAIAKHHEEAGFSVRKTEVKAVPLREIFDEHGDREIHWLKIDVEGMESDVIESWFPSSARPWIVVVESTEPLTETATKGAWEPSLLDVGYEFVYFDGLNRFYLSKDHLELRQHFDSPPNVFDDAMLSGIANSPLFASTKNVQDQLKNRTIELTAVNSQCAAQAHKIDALAQQLDALNTANQQQAAQLSELAGVVGQRDGLIAANNDLKAQNEVIASELGDVIKEKASIDAMLVESRHAQIALTAEAETLRAHAAALQTNAQLLGSRLKEIRNSTSWRLTAPLRFVGGGSGRVGRGAIAWISLKPGTRPRRIARRVVTSMARRTYAAPGIRKILGAMLGLVPPLHRRVKKLVSESNRRGQHAQPQSFRQNPIPVPSTEGPRPVPNVAPTSGAGLKLDSEYGASLADWNSYVSTLFAAKLPAAASLDSNSANRLSALWLVIESRGEAHDIALRESLASIKKLNKVADFSIQVILISKAPQDATQYEAILGQDIPVHYKQSIGSALTLPNAEDLIGFLRPGDTIMPEFAQAIQNCTNSIPEFIVSDLFFQDQGRVFPVLLPGLNYCHALNCDYFRSRFFSNAGVARLVSSGDEEISPRDLSLRVFERIYADEKWDSARHIALPLIGIQDSIEAIGEERQALSASDTPALSAHGNVVGAKSAIPPHCVSIIICTKDKGYLLRQLVTHILATKSDLISEIVIISNQTSAPHALRALSDLAASEKIRVVDYDGAFNFSDQCNLGAKYAKGEYFLFLNDDIAPVSDDWLEELVLPAMNKRVSLVAPLLIYPDERVQHAGMYLGYNNIAGHQLRAAHFPEDEYMFLCSAPRFVSVVTGAAMLIPRERFELLNGFDTNFATYIQDVDLCLRIGASGHDIVFNPRSILIHMESPSIKKMLSNEPVMHTRAKEYELFRRRWEGKLNRDAFHNENYDLNDESMRSLIS